MSKTIDTSKCFVKSVIDALSRAKIERAAKSAGMTLEQFAGIIINKKIDRISG